VILIQHRVARSSWDEVIQVESLGCSPLVLELVLDMSHHRAGLPVFEWAVEEIVLLLLALFTEAEPLTVELQVVLELLRIILDFES